MYELEDLEDRKLVWWALSDLYLDTELDENDFKYIALTIFNSPYTYDKVREIDQYEVFPVLFSNLLNPMGEWGGFNDKILFKNVLNWMESRTKLDMVAVQWGYPMYRWMNKEYWRKIEEIYSKM